MQTLKHTVRSRSDKKPTILNSDMTKLVGPNFIGEKITLYYHDYNCSITYHKGDQQGNTWYADTIPPSKMLLPLIGIPIYYLVSYVAENEIVTMNLQDEFQPIRDWAVKRDLYKRGDLKTQMVKLQEEIGELAKAILHDDKNEFEDGVGDVVVVLTNLCGLVNIRIEDCINQAFLVIAERKGKMENGTFVKE